MPESNPYQPSRSLDENNSQSFRLRMIPAVILGLFGLASFAWGLLALIIFLAIMLRDDDSSTPLQIRYVGLMLMASTVFLGVGCLTMIAAWQIWKQRVRRALAYMGVAVLLIAVVGTANAIWG